MNCELIAIHHISHHLPHGFEGVLVNPVDGVIGSRMTGGGFGGCTVSLVREEAIPTFIEEVGKAYTAKTGLKADFYIAEISDGARQL